LAISTAYKTVVKNQKIKRCREG